MNDLVAITYEDQAAYQALDKLVELQKMKVIELEDAAVAVMNEKGNVKVKQTLERQQPVMSRIDH